MKSSQEPILDRLKEERVLDVYRPDGTNLLHFIEACDEYYKVSLTKDEVYQLIDELKYLADNLK